MYSTVTGGSNNAATSNYAAINGGYQGTPPTPSPQPSAGYPPTRPAVTAHGRRTAVNTASGNHATVTGGMGNTADGDYSSVVGGLGNDPGPTRISAEAEGISARPPLTRFVAVKPTTFRPAPTSHLLAMAHSTSSRTTLTPRRSPVAPTTRLGLLPLFSRRRGRWECHKELFFSINDRRWHWEQHPDRCARRNHRRRPIQFNSGFLFQLVHRWWLPEHYRGRV